MWGTSRLFPVLVGLALLAGSLPTSRVEGAVQGSNPEAPSFIFFTLLPDRSEELEAESPIADPDGETSTPAGPDEETGTTDPPDGAEEATDSPPPEDATMDQSNTEQGGSGDPTVTDLEPEVTIDTAVPTRLLIPSIDVDSEVVQVGLTPEGAMDAPKDPDQIGWYNLGPIPGEPGNAAIVGHVDWAGRVRAFWNLQFLEPGDQIEVRTRDDTSYRFEVQWLRWYDAATAPIEEIFGGDEIPEITLITCGGVFDREAHLYLSRLVVRAVLLPS